MMRDRTLIIALLVLTTVFAIVAALGFVDAQLARGRQGLLADGLATEIQRIATVQESERRAQAAQLTALAQSAVMSAALATSQAEWDSLATAQAAGSVALADAQATSAAVFTQVAADRTRDAEAEAARRDMLRQVSLILEQQPPPLGPGQLLASATLNLPSASIRPEITRYIFPPETPTLLSFSPDGTLLVTASPDSLVIVWRLQDMFPEHVFTIPNRLTTLTINPNSDRIALLIDDRLALWGVNQSGPFPVIQLQDRGQAVAFSPSGGRVAVVQADGRVFIFSASDGALQNEIASPLVSMGGAGAAFSPDSGMLVTSAGSEILMWNVEQSRLTRRLTAHTAPLVGLALSADGKRLVSADESGRWLVWDVRDDTPLHDQMAPGARFAFSPAGFLVLTEDAVTLYDMNGDPLQALSLPPASRLAALTLAPDAQQAALVDSSDIALWQMTRTSPYIANACSRTGRNWMSQEAPEGLEPPCPQYPPVALTRADLSRRIAETAAQAAENPSQRDSLFRQLAASLTPSVDIPIRNLACAEGISADAIEAIFELCNATVLNAPSDIFALINRGQAWVILGDRPKAITDFETAVRVLTRFGLEGQTTELNRWINLLNAGAEALP